jgi:hypothetical protein
MEIKAKEITFVDIDSLIPNPKNNNKHPKEQIERLSKLIKYQGFRNPLVVSSRSGFVLCGHGRIEAAKLAGMKQLPVMYQDFENEAQEYAYLTSDNAIASWSELDLSLVNTEMLDLGPDFDIELLGIENFTIDPVDSQIENQEILGDRDFSNELGEKNDYIVLLFDQKEDFEVAKEMFEVKPVKLDLSESGTNKNMIIGGIGRVVYGKSIIKKFKGN